MKRFTTLLLLLTLLLSVLASCQGTVPTGSLPQTKETAPLTEEKKTTGDGVPPSSKSAQKPVVNPYENAEPGRPFPSDEELKPLFWEERLNKICSDATDLSSLGLDLMDEADSTWSIQSLLKESLREYQASAPYKNAKIVRFFYHLDAMMQRAGIEEIQTEAFFFRDGMAVLTDGTNRDLVYLTAEAKKQTELSVPEGVTRTAERVFGGYRAEVLRLPDSLVWMGDLPLGNPKLKKLEYRADGRIELSKRMLDSYESPDGDLEACAKKKEGLALSLAPDPAEAYVIEDGVLVNYLGLGGNLVIPDGVRVIKGDAFRSVTGYILSVKFPESLEQVETGAFWVGPPTIRKNYAQYLHELELPDGVKQVPSSLVNGNCFTRLTVAKDCVVEQNAIPFPAQVIYRD